VYETLTSDTAPADREARVRKTLRTERNRYRRDRVRLVTHPTVRSHLNDCLHRSIRPGRRRSRPNQHEIRSNGRERDVLESSNRQSRGSSAQGIVSIRDIEVAVTIQITCSDCGSTYRFGELLGTDRVPAPPTKRPHWITDSSPAFPTTLSCAVRFSAHATDRECGLRLLTSYSSH